MAYVTPRIGTVLVGLQNTTVKNPGPVQDANGDALNEWLQAQAQDKAWQMNKVLIQEWQDRIDDSPSYAKVLGNNPSWAVEVVSAEAGGVTFDLVRKGPKVNGIVTVVPEAASKPKMSWE